MRLVCPNCATQYEVDDSAVPAGGREVQCGNCSSTWFQAPARSNISSASKEKLPEWVDDIVADDTPEETPELPGELPNIETPPNEEIISEPELDVVLEADDLSADATPAEPKQTDPVPPFQDENAAKAAAQQAVAATLGAGVAAATGAGLAGKSEENTSLDETTTAPSVDEQDEVGAPPEDAWDGADKAASRLSNEEALVTAEATENARKAAAEAAAIEAAEKAAEDTLHHEAQAALAPTVASVDVDVSEVDAPAVAAEADSEDVVANAVARLAAETKGTVGVDHAEELETPDDTSSQETAPEDADLHSAEVSSSKVVPEDVQKEVAAALEALDAGKPVPNAPDQERLSDYDFTDGELTDDAADKVQAFTEEASATSEAIQSAAAESSTEFGDVATNEFETSDSDRSLDAEPGIDTESQMIEALEEDAHKDQTESLAAKLKARVAEAAKSQESSNLGTAGMVLGASAAGIAASESRRPTSFPKRDTEELSSSLRPKAIEGGSLKPRLRPPATPEPTQSRFGQGFMIAIALFALALLVYLFRNQLAVAIPALEPALMAYAGFVDNIRLMIQDLLGQVFGSPEGTTPEN